MIGGRGRLWGRFNFIDAAIGVLVLLLIPVAYLAYVLFRAPVPQVTTVEPSVLDVGRPATVRLTGRHFRPYIRAYAGNHMVAFLFEHSTHAEVRLPALEPGVYDLVLYDEARELSRAPGALTVKAPVKRLAVHGAFTGLDTSGAAAFHRDLIAGKAAAPAWARLLEVFPPQRISSGPTAGQSRVPAVIEVECTEKTSGCAVGDIRLAADTVLPIPVAGSARNFQIHAVGPTNVTPIEVLVRVQGPAELEAVAKPGDVDAQIPAAGQRFQATLLAFRGGDGTGIGARAGTARFRVPAFDTPAGWEYHGNPVKVGRGFVFETADYFIQGVIIAIKAPDDRQGPIS